MLTPVEESGLSGHGLEGRLRQIFYGLSPELLGDLEDLCRDAARARHLIYLHEGRPEPIRVFLRPLLVMPDQLGYLHFVTLTILNALKRVPELCRLDPQVRELFYLSDEEWSWIEACASVNAPDNIPLLGRLDAVIEFGSPMWKDSLKFLEPNLSGVGGIHLGPTCDQILADTVLPIVERQAPELRIELGRDLRELLIQEVVDHLEALGRHGRNLCFVEPKYAGEGPDEQEALCEYYHQRHGMRILHADPAELTLAGDDVLYDGQVIDMAYRDYEVRDLIELEKSGVNLAPMRALFRQNRVISALAGDFDHKSCWELLTDPRLTNRYFTAEERQVFRRHILWTRLVADRETMAPDGDVCPLLPFAREERETLVLKPNRSYGGDRVLIGRLVTEAEWNQALDDAAAQPGQWVVQQQAVLPVTEFPVFDAEQNLSFEPFHVVYGFAATRYGISIVGRASQKQVVNVAQRGGMCSIMVGESETRLVGR